MKKDTFDKSIRKLGGTFGRTITDDMRAFFAGEFVRVDDSVFEAAVDEVIRSERSFPTPKVLRNYIVEVEQANENKRRQHDPIKQLTDFDRPTLPSDSDLIDQSRKILARIGLKHGHAQHLCGQDLIAEMRLMEKTWPGQGWGKAANGLAIFMARDKKQQDNKDVVRDG